MVWQFSYYSIPYFVAALVSLGVVIMPLNRRRSPGAVTLAVILCGFGLWSLADGLQWASANLEAQLFWNRLRFVAVELSTVLYAVFAAQYLGQDLWVTPRNVLLIYVVPVLLLCSLWFDVPPGAFIVSSQQVTVSTFVGLDVQYGVLFWVHALYDYVFVFFGLFLLFRSFVRAPRFYRAQIAVTSIAALVPMLASVSYVTGVFPLPYFDPTPLTFAISGVAFVLGFYRFSLMDIVPAGRDLLIQNMDDALLIVDDNERVVDLNPSAGRIVGSGAAHIIGSAIADVLPEWQTLRAQIADAGTRREIEFTRAAKDRMRAYEVRVSPVNDKKGQLKGRMLLIRDITTRKVQEDELLQAKRAAEAASQAKGAFLATVSHELRTPLTSVIGFAKINKKRLDDVVAPVVPPDQAKAQRALGQMHENFDIIIAEGERLTALINDVLDLSKIEAGKIVWNMQPLAMKDVVTQALNATAALFTQKNLQTQVELEEGLPEVNGDRDRLVQVVINLLSNAVKFTKQGAVTCAVARDGEWIVTRVQDTGIGIAPQDLQKVFEEFVQVGDTLTDKPQGTGLGLPICKRIIEHHGGTIWVESKVGSGSTFAFKLPVLKETEA